MDARLLFEHQVEDTIRRFSMIPDHAAVLAGVSGGADSTALLLVLCALAASHDWHVEVLHIEHGIRGDESRADAAFVMELCRSLGVPGDVCSVDVPALAKQQKTGMEETARDVRREKLLSRAAAMENEMPRRPVVIALAHHAQDNAETLLFHLARGTGAGGLCGIRPVQGPFVRPLLCCTRTQIEDYLAAAGQPWQTDSTNSDAAYARNRIRMEAVPALCAVNDGVLRHMTDTAFQMQEMEDWLQRSARDLLNRHTRGTADPEDERQMEVRNTPDEPVASNREPVPDRQGTPDAGVLPDTRNTPSVLLRGLVTEDPVPAKEALRLWLAASASKQVERIHVEAAWQLLRKGWGRLSLPGGGIWADAEGLHRAAESPQRAKKSENQKSSAVISIGPGETAEAEIGGVRVSFCVRPIRPGEVGEVQREKETGAAWQADLPFGPVLAETGAGAAPKTYTKRFDYDKIEQISLRTRQPGDSLDIGENRHKSIRRYFIDMRVPKEKRDEVLLLCDGSDVLWVIGARMGDRCKLTEETRQVLEVQATGVPMAAE